MLASNSHALAQVDSIDRRIEAIIRQNTQKQDNERNTANIEAVWRPRKFVNFSAFKLGTNTLTPQESIRAGLSDDKEKDPLIGEFKSDWQFSFLFGFNPKIAALEQWDWGHIGLDIVIPDLTVSHYKAEGNGESVYDSRVRRGVTTMREDGYAYTPWNLEKYQMDLGARVGPSFTLAPFIGVRSVPDLQHVRLKVYLHIGYRASLLLMSGREQADASYVEVDGNWENSKDNQEKYYEAVANGTKLEWGHGATTTWGCNLSWKNIGIGYERTSGDLSFQSCLPGTFGHDEDEFRSVFNRVYLQLRW